MLSGNGDLTYKYANACITPFDLFVFLFPVGILLTNTMKLFSLVLALFISVVVAYEIPGAYERVFLWYAREIDTKTRIAPGCPRPCSFNQFVAYISDPILEPVPNIIDENDRLPKVNTAVKALLAKGLSQQYDIPRILSM